ncbi:MAG: hypothetical protein PHE21_03580, partial [Candidatus Dojkabacteria bacterium]|nr:hypothetical protein [Candidatus Dojkabacteria bacterium]
TPDVDLKPEFKFTSELVFDKAAITNTYTKGYIYISNTGNIALSDYEILKSNITDLKQYIDPINNMTSQILLPNQSSTIQVNLPTPKEDTNVFINISFKNSGPFTGDTLLESDIKPTTPILLSVFVKILSLGLFSLIVILIYFGVVKLRRNE